MATEKIIKGKRYKRYNGIWVTADGKYVEVDTIWKTGFSEIPSTKPATAQNMRHRTLGQSLSKCTKRCQLKLNS